jgi:transcriptional regulator with XRE-family HTH domain
VPRRIPPYAPVVRYLRHQSGMTAVQWGQRLGVPDYYVSYLENGYRWPRPPMVRAIAGIVGWEPFELALVADVEIPYPDWPATSRLEEWRQLARDWTAVADAVARYALARQLQDERGWQAELDPDLPADVDDYGLVACYGWLRARWTPFRPHECRLTAARSAADIRAAVGAGAGAGPAVVDPPFLAGLSAADRAAVEAVAHSLRRQHEDAGQR